MATFKAGTATYGGLPKGMAAKKPMFGGAGGIASGRVPKAAVAGIAPAAPFMQTVDSPAMQGMPGAPAPRDFAAEAASNPDVWKDSAYNSALSSLLASKVAGENALTTNGRRAAEDRSKNLGMLGEGRGKARTQTTQSANNRGLFYSGILGKQLGDVDTDFGRRENDVNESFSRGEQDRASQRAGLESSFDEASRQAQAQAVDRWIAGSQGEEAASTPSIDSLVKALAQWNVGTSNARKR